jgi:hypothetical protein
MKNIFIRLLTILLFTACSFAAAAQTGSMDKNRKPKDSILRTLPRGHIVPDIIYRTYEVMGKLKTDSIIDYGYGYSDSMYKKRKTAVRSKQVQYDSVYKKIPVKIISSYRSQNDSLYKKRYSLYKVPDSLKRMHQLSRLSYDSLQKLYPAFKLDSFHRYKLNYAVTRDSSKRLTASKHYKTDSIRKLFSLSVQADSFQRYKVRQSIKLDSLRALHYRQNIKSDSQRIKLFLHNKKQQLQQFHEDTASVKNGYRSRNLSMEITCRANDTVYINNNYKKLIIKVIPSQKMRLSTSINYREALNNRDHEVLKLMGIEIGRSGNHVTATINTATPESYRDSNDKNDIKDASVSAACRELNSETNVKRALLIELPGNAIIFLTSKFADADIESYVPYVNVTITNGTLKMGSAGYAVIKSKFSTVKVDDINNAHLNLVATKFTGGNVILMNVVSSNSSLQLDRSGTMQLNSVSDQYQVENAGSISGNKNFGKLTIEHLKDQLILTGANADLKISSVAAETPLIKIDNKYADLKVPVYHLNNYSIHYEGSPRDVTKISVANGGGSITAVQIAKKDSFANTTFTAAGNAAVKDSNNNTIKGTGINKTVFEAISGDVKGKHTKVDIVCAFCNVAFK